MTSPTPQVSTEALVAEALERCAAEVLRRRTEWDKFTAKMSRFDGRRGYWKDTFVDFRLGDAELILADLKSKDAIISQQAGRIAKLEARLKPFSDEAAWWDGTPGLVRYDDSLELWQSGRTRICVGDLRQARAVLNPETSER